VSTEPIALDPAVGDLDIDRNTGIADCRSCDFHGRAIDHLAYRSARDAGFDQGQAYEFAQRHRRRVKRDLPHLDRFA
jgi:hypothetical protein